MTDPVNENVTKEQFHAYDQSGVYQGIVIATAAQLSSLGWTAGDAPVPDVAALKARAVEQVKTRHAEMLVKLSGDYSSEERETWLLQLEWARGFADDQNTAHAVLLSGMFATSPTGIMVEDARLMADKIIGKSTAYAKLVMLSQRTKSQALAAIEAAQTPEQLATTMTDLAAIEAAAIVELTQEEDTP